MVNLVWYNAFTVNDERDSDGKDQTVMYGDGVRGHQRT